MVQPHQHNLNGFHLVLAVGLGARSGSKLLRSGLFCHVVSHPKPFLYFCGIRITRARVLHTV